MRETAENPEQLQCRRDEALWRVSDVVRARPITGSTCGWTVRSEARAYLKMVFTLAYILRTKVRGLRGAGIEVRR